VRLAWLALVLGFSACATTEGTSGTGGAFGGTGAQDGAGGSGGSGAVGIDSSAGSGGGADVVYAHTDLTLFSLDPTSPELGLKQLGDFDCIGGQGQDIAMTDVAVDSKGALYGISASSVWPLSVTGSVAVCGAPISLAQAGAVKFYALTFAPAGVLDPTQEVLVAGNTAGELWKIDEQGAVTLLGNFGVVPPHDGNGHTYQHAGKAWELSGDVVFLANEGNPVGFATVRDCENPPSTSSCSNDDTLIEIDVGKLATASGGSVTKAVRGLIVKRAGCNDGINGSYDNMYGIGAWGDRVYGLSRAGHLVEVDIVDGTACLVKSYVGAKFSGAGVTTVAPIVVPPPK
jgi:hypothetical protein